MTEQGGAHPSAHLRTPPADRAGIRTYPFDPSASVSGVGIQVGPMGTDGPWAGGVGLSRRVHRIDFHVLLFFREGPVRHMVDFAEYEVGAGDILWIRPGQVHGFSATEAYVGTALTMQPGFLPRAIVEATGLYRYDRPPLLHPDEAQLAAIQASLEQLQREYLDTSTLPLSLHTSVLRHTLTAFMLRVAHVSAQAAADACEPQPDTTFTRFRTAVEQSFTTNHSVSAYADELGYSRRTLVRAVRAATGLTPKAFIDRRVVLEAKRLLAHTDLPVGRIGAAVGVPDSANFSKYFQQHAGITPAAFRAEQT
ncbi:helix-turn-helix domain-containing protein [Streptomyces sp. SID8379]|uniref:helix-turn-helix domain-containing protein n=1 Tax=unclassified Streptomyces TaxID=2593676 RepID=UPI00037217CB|nr:MULTISPECIES: AraC family transcriptional regulator [unclassified Streptomyces]MYW67764.1 helix-turn-helix domain-containing protein [Streptomyces sp. SID8379]